MGIRVVECPYIDEMILVSKIDLMSCIKFSPRFWYLPVYRIRKVLGYE